MPKRGADKQITKDNHEDDGDDDEVPTEQAVASEEKLAQRKMVKVKRKVTTGESAPTGAKFSFADAAAGEAKKPAAAAAAAAAAPAAAAAGAAAPKTGFFAHFSAGMWECPDCMLQNKPGVAKCPACTCPNPNMAQEPKKSEAEQVADAGVTFGGGDSAPASAAAPAAAAAAASESIFGTTVAGFGADGGFAFGGGASFGDMSSGDSSALTATNPDFATVTTTPSEAPNPAAAQFVGKKAESSGEEKDTTVYTTKCKVYLLKLVPKNVKESALPKDDDEGAAKEDKPATNGAKAGAAAAAADSDEKEQKYVEIGSGDLKLNKFTKDDGSAGARMILRAEKVQRLVVNAPIFDGMSYAIQNEKYVRFISMGLPSDGEPAKLQAHLLRFKSKAEATDVHTHITQLIAGLKGKK